MRILVVQEVKRVSFLVWRFNISKYTTRVINRNSFLTLNRAKIFIVVIIILTQFSFEFFP